MRGENKQEEGVSQKPSEEQMSRKGMTSCINRAVWLNRMRTENGPQDLRVRELRNGERGKAANPKLAWTGLY